MPPSSDFDPPPGPVFVDETGRRRRVVRAVGFVVAALTGLFLALVGVSLVASPGLLPLHLPGVGPLLPNAAAPKIAVGTDHRKPAGQLVGPGTAVASPTATPGGVPVPTATPAAGASSRSTPATRGTGSPTARPTPRRTGSPTATPTPRRTGSPTARPTTRSTGSPTAHPTRRGTGKPTAHPTHAPRASTP